MNFSFVGQAILVARIPADPGFPEAVVIDPHQNLLASLARYLYVTGPAAFNTAGLKRGRVWQFGRLGNKSGEYVIEDQMQEAPHAVSGACMDGNGRLYVLDVRLGLGIAQIVRFNPKTPSVKEVYATCADLPNPPMLPPDAPNLPALLNDMCFDSAGNLFITDSLQGIVWRVAPGGGAAAPWFTSSTIATEFGPNGIRIGHDGRVYFAVSGVLTGKVGNQVAAIYSLPNLPTPSLNDLRLEYQFEDAHAIPDGLAFSESGKLYVTVAGQNSIVVLEKQGQGCQFVEVNRFSGPISVIGQKMKIPFDAPAVCAFDDRIKALYVANHALLSCDSSHFCVFAVYTGEKGYPLFYPCLV